MAQAAFEEHFPPSSPQFEIPFTALFVVLNSKNALPASHTGRRHNQQSLQGISKICFQNQMAHIPPPVEKTQSI